MPSVLFNYARGSRVRYGFVNLEEFLPDATFDIRYYSTNNFVGKRIDGYEAPAAYLTKEAAIALRAVSDDLLSRGYRLRIYDAYRPCRAVAHLVRWARDPEATEMQARFYPHIEKSTLLERGYIAEKSSHSRGSTVDLTLVSRESGEELDMGGEFDFFGERSHSDYTDDLTPEAVENRRILREAMTSHGFLSLPEEWWHYTLADEPYPETYFDFPVTVDADDTEYR